MGRLSVVFIVLAVIFQRNRKQCEVFVFKNAMKCVMQVMKLDNEFNLSVYSAISLYT